MIASASPVPQLALQHGRQPQILHRPHLQPRPSSLFDPESRLVPLPGDLSKNGRRSKNLLGLLPQEIQPVELRKEK